MPEFTPEQKAELSAAYTRVHGNGEAFARKVTEMHGPFRHRQPTDEECRKLKEITGEDPHLFIRAEDRLEEARRKFREAGEEEERRKARERDDEARKWSAVVDNYLKRINGEPSTGTKHDADKPDAGTVLAGFWSLVRQRLNVDGGIVHLQPNAVPLAVLDRLFDSTVSISKRLTDACALLPNSSLEQTLRPGTYGARKKYNQDNWLTVVDGVNRYYQAAGRHTLRMILGEEKDAEGLIHGECLVWCIWAGATHVLKNEEERLRK